MIRDLWLVRRSGKQIYTYITKQEVREKLLSKVSNQSHHLQQSLESSKHQFQIYILNQQTLGDRILPTIMSGLNGSTITDPMSLPLLLTARNNIKLNLNHFRDPMLQVYIYVEVVKMAHHARGPCSPPPK